MPTATAIVKKSIDKGYGPFYFVSDNENKYSEQGKDWCLFLDKECQGQPTSGAIPDGTEITFEFKQSTKNGRDSYYVSKIEMGAQKVAAPQARGTAPGAAMDEQERLFVSNVLAACSGHFSGPSDVKAWALGCQDAWKAISAPERPGDAPQGDNPDYSQYDRG